MKTNHILHIIISLLTAGLWIPIWFIIAQVNASRRAAALGTSNFSLFFMALVVLFAILLSVGLLV